MLNYKLLEQSQELVNEFGTVAIRAGNCSSRLISVVNESDCQISAMEKLLSDVDELIEELEALRNYAESAIDEAVLNIAEQQEGVHAHG